MLSLIDDILNVVTPHIGMHRIDTRKNISSLSDNISNQGPIISMFAIIIFENMYARDLSRYSLLTIDTKDQIADALPKALAQNDFQQHRRYMMCGK